VAKKELLSLSEEEILQCDTGDFPRAIPPLLQFLVRPSTNPG
jgi:hypothetical protein